MDRSRVLEGRAGKEENFGGLFEEARELRSTPGLGSVEPSHGGGCRDEALAASHANLLMAASVSLEARRSASELCGRGMRRCQRLENQLVPRKGLAFCI
jgi:hypothetical protein